MTQEEKAQYLASMVREAEAKEVLEQQKFNSFREEILECLLSKPSKITSATFTLAHHFMEKYPIITFEETNEMYFYEDGVYSVGADKRIAGEIEELVRVPNKTEIVTAVMDRIKRLTYRKHEHVKEPANMICAKNVVINLDKLNSLNVPQFHSSDIIFFNKIPIDYITSTDCPNIKKFISEIVNPNDIPLIQEMVGYCLLKRMPFHKAFMLIGDGANGKSTFIRLLKAMLGEQNVTSIPLQQFETNRFATARLFGKLANLFADLPEKSLTQTSFFKILTGNDPVPAEYKFGKGFTFQNYSKLIFSCNRIPKSPDDSAGFHRRWVIINFPNQFNDNPDEELYDKLTTPEELQGFLMYAIEGLKRLLSQRHFSNQKSIEETRELYTHLSDSVAAFAMDRLISVSDGWISKKILYANYADYCRELNYPLVAENSFHRNLQGIIRVEDERRRIEGLQERGWLGIAMKNSETPGFRKVEARFLPCQGCGATHSMGWTWMDNNNKIYCDICVGVY